MGSGIYIIFNLVSGKVYIGKSIEVSHRLSQHKADLRSGRHCNPHLQKAWNVYGEDSFTFTLLEACPIDSLGIRESFYIGLYASLDRKRGYNIEEPTAEGGRRMSEETKQKLSAINKGKKLSEETKGKIGIAAKGLKHPPRSDKWRRKQGIAKGKPFYLIDPNGVAISGHNLRAFCRERNLGQGAMNALRLGKIESYKGWQRQPN